MITRVGLPGEPVAELIKFGWTIMSPGEEINLHNMLLTQVHREDYEQLCRLDVLGLRDSATGDQQNVYREFKEQLTRSEEGWYETSLPWQVNHPPLPNNKSGSLKRLDNLVRKFEKQNIIEQYDKIVKEQIKEGIVEKVDTEAQDREFYLPHKAVIRESAETTKLRIVYDASARGNQNSPSLNECLETRPPLQNHLWQVLIRGRFHSVALTGDLKQAFLQIRIREEDRDVMRFHWFKDLKTKEVVTLRFTRALFGLSPSPFLLGGVIQQHLEKHVEQHPEIVKEINNCFGCRRFHATHFPNPQPGKLPKDRTEGDLAFQVVGVDYACPIRYQKRGKQEGKAYIIVYACSLTRAMYLELTKTCHVYRRIPFNMQTIRHEEMAPIESVFG